MKRRKGLTLIELLIVVLILGALAAIAVPRISESAQNAKENACATNIDIMNSQIELYYANKSLTTYPALGTVTGDPNYFPDGAPTCPLNGVYSLDGNSRVQCSLGH